SRPSCDFGYFVRCATEAIESGTLRDLALPAGVLLLIAIAGALAWHLPRLFLGPARRPTCAAFCLYMVLFGAFTLSCAIPTDNRYTWEMLLRNSLRSRVRYGYPTLDPTFKNGVIGKASDFLVQRVHLVSFLKDLTQLD